jgi:hypothetical protein
MQMQLQQVHQRRPETFHYSLDWRFLLPMGNEKNVYVLSEDDPDLSQALEQTGIPRSHQLSFLERRENKRKSIQSLIIPFGLPVHLLDAKHGGPTEFYSVCRRSMASGGYLLTGFNNAWYFRANHPSKYHTSTPRRVTDQLKGAGFQSIKMFGAMSSLAIPEYIFDLESRALRFALQHRFRRKPVLLKTLRALAGTVGLAPLLNLLPCYFAVATV